MTEKQRQEILDKAKALYKENIALNHVSNLKKLSKLSEFNYNPFLLSYLANFIAGDNSPASLAKVLIYPRILGTSINTSFGLNFQRFSSQVLKSVLGSTTPGIDIEFVDQVDKRKKYCQLKSGPQTINNPDVETISAHFESAKRLARTNNLNLGIDDFIIGVIYGTSEKLSGNYKQLSKKYPVYVGKDFWHRLTGDRNFYEILIDKIGEVAKEFNSKSLLNETIEKLAEDIKNNFINKELG